MSTTSTSTTAAPPEEAKRIARAITDGAGLRAFSDDLRRNVLRELVQANWGDLPKFSTLTQPEISVVAKATVGTGVVPIFKDEFSGQWMAVVVRPGTHYQSARYAADKDNPYSMIAGGFINLTSSEGVEGVVAAAPGRGEHPAEGAVRELTEEIVDNTGSPVLKIAPDRLLPMDTLTLTFSSGERRVVIGFAVMLTAEEVQTVQGHVHRLQKDEEYRRACRGHTINPDSGKPEICQVDIVPLAELAAQKVTLLHPDQKSLFQRISTFLGERHS